MILEKWKWRREGETQELKSTLIDQQPESEQGKKSMQHVEWVVDAKMKSEVLIHIQVRGKQVYGQVFWPMI